MDVIEALLSGSLHVWNPCGDMPVAYLRKGDLTAFWPPSSPVPFVVKAVWVPEKVEPAVKAPHLIEPKVLKADDNRLRKILKEANLGVRIAVSSAERIRMKIYHGDLMPDALRKVCSVRFTPHGVSLSFYPETEEWLKGFVRHELRQAVDEALLESDRFFGKGEELLRMSLDRLKNGLEKDIATTPLWPESLAEEQRATLSEVGLMALIGLKANARVKKELLKEKIEALSRMGTKGSARVKASFMMEMNRCAQVEEKYEKLMAAYDISSCEETEEVSP